VANIRLVDAHPERNRGDDDHDVARGEPLVAALLVGLRHASVIVGASHPLTLELFAHRLARLPRLDVYDGGLGELAEVKIPLSVYVDFQIGAAGAESILVGLVNVEHLVNVVHDAGRGGGGDGEHRNLGKRGLDNSQLQVALAEVVAPLRYAMRLVDGKQPNNILYLFKYGDASLYKLGRRVYNFIVFVFADVNTGLGVQTRAVNIFGIQIVALVVHQRNQRRHHNRKLSRIGGRKLV